jgi:hypothetical protein
MSSPRNHGSKPAPPDRRPYRKMYEPGPETFETVVDEDGRHRRQTWKQIGWQGQSGAFYALGDDAKPMDHEPGSFTPIHVLVDSTEEPPAP